MAKREFGQEILEGLQEIKVYKQGKVDLCKLEFHPPASPAEIRAQLLIGSVPQANTEKRGELVL